jgi:hypothetical protein
MQNPVPASQLGSQPYMQCGLPNIGKEICNGLENISINNNIVSGNLLNSCNFNTATWHTCFNCPSKEPTMENPTPESIVAKNDPKFRHPVPNDCDSVWWDPIAGQCLCTNTNCAYNDTAVPISSTSSTSKVTNNTTSGSSSQQTNATNGGAPIVTMTVFGLTLTAASVVALIL